MTVINKTRILKIVDWNLTRKCNYRCSYCATKQERTILLEEKPQEVLSNLLPLFDDSCHFILGGSGEPFLAYGFFEIIKTIISRGHEIIIVTNFSAPKDQIKRFIKITSK